MTERHPEGAARSRGDAAVDPRKYNVMNDCKSMMSDSLGESVALAVPVSGTAFRLFGLICRLPYHFVVFERIFDLGLVGHNFDPEPIDPDLAPQIFRMVFVSAPRDPRQGGVVRRSEDLPAACR